MISKWWIVALIILIVILVIIVGVVIWYELKKRNKILPIYPAPNFLYSINPIK